MRMSSFLLVFCILGATGSYGITISGTVELENQSTHDGVEVTLTRTQPSSLVESAYSSADGAFSIDVEGGYYIIEYAKDGYFSETIEEKPYYSSTTLSDMVLLVGTTRLVVPDRFATIQNACDYALDGDTILIREGVYHETGINVTSCITMASEYLIDSDTSHISSTIIDGQGNGILVTAAQTDSFYICGLTLQNGYRGIYCDEVAYPRIVSCVVRENDMLNSDIHAKYGAGIYCYGPVVLEIDHCIVEDNIAESRGAIDIRDPSEIARVTNSIIRKNRAVNIEGGPRAAKGAGLSATGWGYGANTDSILIRNTLICENVCSSQVTGLSNEGSEGAGSWFWGIHAELQNVTISNNTSDSAGAIWCGTSTSGAEPGLSLHNCIIGTNSSAEDIKVTTSYFDFVLENCIVEREFQKAIVEMYGRDIPYIGEMATTNSNGDSTDAYGNVCATDHFVDDAGGDYHLADWSRAIGAGDASTATGSDIEGTNRGTPPDIGAYENTLNAPEPLPAPHTPQLMSPVDNAVDITLPLSLMWHDAAYAFSYTIQISAVGDFSSLLVDEVRNDTSFSFSNGTNGTTYYWRVRSSNSTSASSWSNTRSFATLPLSPPTLQAPPDAAEDIDTAITFLWTDVAGAESYHLHVSTTSDFSDTVLSDSALTDTSHSVHGLRRDTVYYWRVCSKNEWGRSGWSDISSFATIPWAPSAPVLISPDNNALHQPLAAVMRWETTKHAGTYRVQLSADAGFSDILLVDSTVKDTQISSPPLQSSTNYFWRVNARNAGGTSAWSSVYSFMTVQTITGAPQLVSPANGSQDQPLAVTLRWDMETGADSYHLQVSGAHDESFSTTTVDDSSITATSRIVDTLSGFRTYYWRVRAKRTGSTGPWSDTWRFSTARPPENVPLLVTPEDMAANQRSTLEFRWNRVDDAERYLFQLSKDDMFASPFVSDSFITDTSRIVESLSDSTTYYWRVRAANNIGYSSWPAPWSFTTLPPPPDTVKLISPSNDTILHADSVHFLWHTHEDNVEYYCIEIFTDSVLKETLLIDSTVTDTCFDESGLKNHTDYWWRIRARNIAGWGPCSVLRKFSIELIPTRTRGVPEKFSWGFEGVSKSLSIVRFGIPHASNVNLRLYGLNGELITTVIDGYRDPGYHSVAMEVKNTATGPYILMFKAGEYSSKRMVIDVHR